MHTSLIFLKTYTILKLLLPTGAGLHHCLRYTLENRLEKHKDKNKCTIGLATPMQKYPLGSKRKIMGQYPI